MNLPKGLEMKVKAGLGLALVLALAGCGENQLVGRAADPTGLATGLTVTGERVAAAWHVVKVEVNVPRSLRVSEENSFVPMADIVWHGDMLGDRYAQVQNIMAEAAARGTAGMKRGEAVVVQVDMLRFHALTPKARYTFGGNFATRFLLTVRDAHTGEVLDGPRLVVADCPASGGQKALAEEEAGITQRVVIVDHVAGVFAHELSTRALAPLAAPVVSRNAFQPSDLGVMQ